MTVTSWIIHARYKSDSEVNLFLVFRTEMQKLFLKLIINFSRLQVFYRCHSSPGYLELFPERYEDLFPGRHKNIRPQRELVQGFSQEVRRTLFPFFHFHDILRQANLNLGTPLRRFETHDSGFIGSIGSFGQHGIPSSLIEQSGYFKSLLDLSGINALVYPRPSFPNNPSQISMLSNAEPPRNLSMGVSHESLLKLAGVPWHQLRICLHRENLLSSKPGFRDAQGSNFHHKKLDPARCRVRL
jgi:hypothetical protein